MPPPGGAGKPPPPGSRNIDGAIGRAWDTMRAFLLQPFNLGAWFAFGFIVWPCDLGEGRGLPTHLLNLLESLGPEYTRIADAPSQPPPAAPPYGQGPYGPAPYPPYGPPR